MTINDDIRPISKNDPRCDIIKQRPLIIHNHKTRDSYVTLEINANKEYILKNDTYLNKRNIRIQDASHYSSSDYFEF